MKKFTLAVMAVCLSLSFMPATTMAAALITLASAVAAPAPNPEVEALQSRLNDINTMDKSDMKSSEKRSIRKEVRSIKHRMSDIGGGVYISAGVLILIIILLIILL